MNLADGTVIKTKYGQATVQLKKGKPLGAGGQGTVYLVDYAGKPMVLKWYHTAYLNSLENPKAFYENLQHNVESGSPTKNAPKDVFLWPKDISVGKQYGSFGYIMELRPDNYVELSKFLRTQTFSSFRARIDAMLNMVNAFRMLHNQGYSYQDLNDGNFFIDPSNGDVLVCDNDNVAYTGYSTGIKGKMRYMAPEVVLNQHNPDPDSDKFSLALLLFLLACKTHPLEGAAAAPACMTPAYERMIYGSKACFIFDPEDASNRPIRGVNDTAIKMWQAYPAEMREAFCKSFSKTAMTNGGKNNRLTEREWMKLLVHFRNSMVRCACGSEEFSCEPGQTCTRCGAPLPEGTRIQLKRYSLPVTEGVVLYRMQLCECNDNEALIPAAKVITAPGSKKAAPTYGIQNISEETWICTTTAGEQKNLAPGGAMPAKPGIGVKTANSEFTLQ